MLCISFLIQMSVFEITLVIMPYSMKIQRIRFNLNLISYTFQATIYPNLKSLFPFMHFFLIQISAFESKIHNSPSPPLTCRLHVRIDRQITEIELPTDNNFTLFSYFSIVVLFQVAIKFSRKCYAEDVQRNVNALKTGYLCPWKQLTSKD